MIEFAATNNLVRIAILLAIFIVVELVLLGAVSVVGRRVTLRFQLQRFGEIGPVPPTATSLRSRATNGAWTRLAAAVEKAGLNLADSKNDRLTARLRAAGYTSPSAPRVFTLARLALIFVLPLGYLVLAYSSDEPPSFVKLYLTGSALALLGLYLPNLYVRTKVDRRKQEIVNGFPDCLDLLLVCVESGLGVEAAMDRVGREMVISHPLIAQLLSITTLQLRAGASREDAFRKLADAAAVDDIRSFTTLLIQSDKLGTSIATTLRVYAAEMREKRRLRAEEKAHRLPVLISIPLVTCMLPSMIGVLMIPAAVRVVREIFPMMAGG